VPADGGIECGRVTGIERVENGLMLGLLGAEATAPGGRATLDPGDKEADADATIGVLQQGIAGELHQRVVELAVEGNVIAVGKIGAPGELGVNGLERCEGGGARWPVGEAAQDGFACHQLQREPYRPELGHMVGRRRADMIAMPRNRLDKTVAGKSGQGFADRRNRDAEANGKVIRIEPRRAGKVAEQDGIEDLPPYCLGDGLADLSRANLLGGGHAKMIANKL